MKTQKVKPFQKAAKEKTPKCCRDFHFTSITSSPNKESRKNHLYVYICSRSEGVTFSQERNIKRSIIAEIESKKTQSQVNFTESSQLCERQYQVVASGQGTIFVASIQAVKPQSKWESDEVKMQHRIVKNGIEERGHPFVSDGRRKIQLW